MAPRDVSKFEQHFGAATQAVVVALLIWTGSSLIGLREQVAVMDVKIISLQATTANDSTSVYRRAEAEREHSNLAANILRLEKRVGDLESKREREVEQAALRTRR